MSEAAKNLGRNSTIAIYVENQRLGRDFLNVTKFDSEDEYATGENAYLNKGHIKKWKIYKCSKGNLSIETDDDGYVQSILDAIDIAESSGLRPSIKIVETTQNTGGPNSIITWIDCIVMGKKGNGEKFNKQTRDFSWEGTNEAKV